jgi:hypothetical protein
LQPLRKVSGSCPFDRKKSLPEKVRRPVVGICALVEGVDLDEQEVAQQMVKAVEVRRAAEVLADGAENLQKRGVLLGSAAAFVEPDLEVSRGGACTRELEKCLRIAELRRAYRCARHGTHAVYPNAELALIEGRPGVAHDVAKVAVRRGCANRQLAFDLQAQPRDRSVLATAVHDKIIERLTGVALLERDAADYATVQARPRRFREEASEILGGYVVREGEACAACKFRRLRHFSIF